LMWDSRITWFCFRENIFEVLINISVKLIPPGLAKLRELIRRAPKSECVAVSAVDAGGVSGSENEDSRVSDVESEMNLGEWHECEFMRSRSSRELLEALGHEDSPEFALRALTFPTWTVTAIRFAPEMATLNPTFEEVGNVLFTCTV
jgi:hypothetical protein